MNQNPGAFDVAEELDAETGAKMRALDEAGHVGHDEGLLVGFRANSHDAEVGFEGGEGVVGDLGLGCRDARDERGFAGVGVAHQANVGQQLQFESVVALFAGASQFVLAGRLVNAGGKVLVAASAAPALGDDHLFVGRLEVVDQLACVVIEEGCAYRDL